MACAFPRMGNLLAATRLQLLFSAERSRRTPALGKSRGTAGGGRIKYKETRGFEHDDHGRATRTSLRTRDRFNLASRARDRGRPHHDLVHFQPLGDSGRRLGLDAGALRLVLAGNGAETSHRGRGRRARPRRCAGGAGESVMRLPCLVLTRRAVACAVASAPAEGVTTSHESAETADATARRRRLSLGSWTLRPRTLEPRI